MLVDRLEAADGWASPASRARQLWHACLLAETTLGDNRRALACVDRILEEHPDSVHQYDALSLRARILERTLPSRAAEAWAAVADTAPAHPDAGRNWLRSADLRAQVGDQLGALSAYERAADHPPQAARAWLAIGRLTLANDPAEAHAAFDRALQAAQRPAMMRVARLGVATALERLEGREAALAEVDEAIAESGPDVALERRRERLRAGG
jgi:tetratricopeptide (TPR) repeat protein